MAVREYPASCSPIDIITRLGGAAKGHIIVRMYIFYISMSSVHTFHKYIHYSILILIYYWCCTNLVFDNTMGTFVCMLNIGILPSQAFD